MTENIKKLIKFTDLADKNKLYTFDEPTTLQVNIGNICNLACKHCHVKASPKGQKVITEDVKDACLKVLDKYSFTTLDLTGGAPEMMPGFEDFILAAKKIVDTVIVRTNLVILEEDGYTHLPKFFAENNVDLVASLPSTTEKTTDRQRGKGVYEKSIDALRSLNDLGYGKGDLKIDLVFNPNGAILPPDQKSLELRYKKELFEEHGIVFDNLFAFTNNPIGRFGEFLKRADLYDDYIRTLVDAFNEDTLDNLMCKYTLSVAWDGKLYDCDFNQAAGLGVKSDVKTIFDLLEKGPLRRPIRTGVHCFACTAGAGSS
ncbi:MAG: arsenosugar biosynthesis radical SAM protein ArsS [Finegoldia sp.]|nr:arsenosugar biosynthesis radical SAM protein ArsS [Finegoldia sp.]